MAVGAHHLTFQYLGRDLDLTSIGIPLKMIIYGCADHDAGVRIIEDAARKNNVPLLDERRKDFGIKGGG